MIEEKFNKLRQELSKDEFDSIEFLTRKAQELEEGDPDLAKRVLVRVKNLKKQHEKQLEKQPLAVSSQSLVKNSSKQEQIKQQEVVNSKQTLIQRLKSSPFFLLVVVPTLIFAFYQIVWATERYESQAKVIVQQPDNMSTLDPSMALLSGLGVPTGNTDAELVKAYIYSNDMIEYLNETVALRQHYEQDFIDYFSRVHNSDSRESLYDYYQKHIQVIIDDKSGVITISCQAFDSEYAQQLTNTIVKRAEWFINSIGHQLANEQLAFVQGEHKLIEERLGEAQKDLLTFQQKYNLLDPTAEGTAIQQITYTLEGQIAAKKTEIKTLKAIMSKNAPQVKSLENELMALESQLANERNKLSQSGQDEIPVSEVLSKFTDYKIKMDLALQAYTASQISLEKSRIEAYRQLKYLITVEQATLSEESKYPDVFYNISLFILIFSMVFGIGKIIITTVNELK